MGVDLTGRDLTLVFHENTSNLGMNVYIWGEFNDNISNTMSREGFEILG